MAKIKNDYFDLMKKQVEFCLKASTLLEEILLDFSVEKIAEQKTKMHAVEQEADSLHHEIHTRLLAEFITPIDQEDILHLVQLIDDITDAIDEVVLYFYMYNVTEITDDAVKMAGVVKRCVSALNQALSELHSFKKPEKLRNYLVEVNSIEGEADSVYVEAIHSLFTTCDDTKRIIGVSAIYDCLENCCDLCEHAADVIEQIIIKNT